MMRSLKFSLALYLALLCAACSATSLESVQAQSVQVESAKEKLQAALDEGAEKGLPGISAAIAGPEGIIWSGVAGYSDIRQKTLIEPDSLFGIGSITKPFVAVVAFQLAEEGLLDLSATAAQILGDQAVEGIPNAESATLLQLLNHTSGIPTWEYDPEWIQDGRGKNIKIGKVWKKDETLKYLKDGGNPATSNPGAKYHYSNTNYTLLGLIIEHVTGGDLAGEVKRRILVPLGIRDVYLDGFQQLPRHRVAGSYHFATAGFREVAGLNPATELVRPGLLDTSATNLSVEWAAGGMLATAADLAVFGAAVAAGKLLDQTSMALFLDFRPDPETDNIVEVGRGIFRMPMTASGAPLINHTGGVLGFSAVMGWLEHTDIAFVLLVNVGTMHADPIDQSEYTPGHFLESMEFLSAYEALAQARRSNKR